MALKIIRASDPITVDRLVVCLYAPPGTGKTTLGFSAHKPLLFDFDDGAYRAAGRKDSVGVSQWQDVASITAEDLEGYDTLVVDTAGRALDALAADIIRRNPKMGRGGALTLQGYGALKTEFAAWVKLIRSFGKDLVLIAHAAEDKSGDEIVERLDIQGGSKQEVYKIADAMGRLVMQPGSKRPLLTFSPSDAAFGKNPGQLEPITVPDVSQEPEFLGGVIDAIKERLNALTAEQQAKQDAIEAWRAEIHATDCADAVNALIPRIREAAPGVAQVAKGVLHRHATETLGLEADRAAGGYVTREVA